MTTDVLRSVHTRIDALSRPGTHVWYSIRKRWTNAT
jgi:hypothetical protein